MIKTLPFALLVLSLAGAAHADPKPTPPLVGDPVNGARLHRLNCASCHGGDGRGKGAMAASLPVRAINLRDADLLLRRGDASLAQSIASGKGASMPAFPTLSPLEIWDLLAYMRVGQLDLAEFFPEVTRYTSKTYRLDAERQKRIEPAVGKLSDAELEVTLAGIFKGQKEGDAPVFVPQDPRALDSLRPENKLGYLSCLPVAMPGIAEPVMTCFALDERGIITAIRAAPFTVTEAQRAGLDPMLAGYLGQGGKAGKNGLYVPLAGKGKGNNPALAKALTRAYYRVLASAAMFDQEELDRNPFD